MKLVLMVGFRKCQTFVSQYEKRDLHGTFQVNAIQMKETVEENTSTTERVFQDRQYQVFHKSLSILSIYIYLLIWSWVL